MSATPQRRLVSFEPVVPAEVASAVDQLLGRYEPDVRGLLAERLLAETPEEGWRTLWQARSERRRLAVAWGQCRPGGCATFWHSPELSVIGPDAGAALVGRVLGQLGELGVSMAQALLESSADPACEVLLRAGFQQLVDLLYLVGAPETFPAKSPAGELEFRACRQRDLPRLAEVIEQTYEETRDCPQLNGVRRAHEVLREYESNGVPHWFLVRARNRDVGCLLLAEHRAEAHAEMVYMGLVPNARGHGWGHALAAQALYLTGQLQLARLVLAVDVENVPARAIYERLGLAACDCRSVYWCQLPLSPSA